MHIGGCKILFVGGKSNINIKDKVKIYFLVEGKSNINIENKAKVYKF